MAIEISEPKNIYDMCVHKVLVSENICRYMYYGKGRGKPGEKGGESFAINHVLCILRYTTLMRCISQRLPERRARARSALSSQRLGAAQKVTSANDRVPPAP